MRLIVRSARVLALLSLVAATPATKPTTRPMTDRDSTLFSSQKRGVEFRIPKNWTRTTAGLPAGSEDEIFVFNYDGGAKKPTPPLGGFPSLSVFVTEPCERQEHLAEVVNDTKRHMPEVNPGSQLIEDHAIEVNGQPAWLLRWQRDLDVKVVTKDSKGNRSEKAAPKLTMVRQKVLFVRNKTICDVGLYCVKTAFDRLLPVADAAAASVVPTAK